MHTKLGNSWSKWIFPCSHIWLQLSTNSLVLVQIYIIAHLFKEMWLFVWGQPVWPCSSTHLLLSIPNSWFSDTFNGEISFNMFKKSVEDLKEFRWQACNNVIFKPLIGRVYQNSAIQNVQYSNPAILHLHEYPELRVLYINDYSISS